MPLLPDYVGKAGKQANALRSAKPYSPQSTQVLSAEYNYGLRTTPRNIGQSPARPCPPPHSHRRPTATATGAAACHEARVSHSPCAFLTKKNPVPSTKLRRQTEKCSRNPHPSPLHGKMSPNGRKPIASPPSGSGKGVFRHLENRGICVQQSLLLC